MEIWGLEGASGGGQYREVSLHSERASGAASVQTTPGGGFS
jgi:hypothetical protein